MKRILFLLVLVSSFASAQVGKQKGFYNVKDYGLKDDSSTDNSALLTSLLAAIPTYGATIYFPGGGLGYKFTSAVTITKNVKIVGDGQEAYKFFTLNGSPLKGSTNLYFTSATATFLTFKNSAQNKYITFSIQDISIINIASSQPSAGNGLYIDSVAQHSSLIRTTVRGFYNDVNIYAGMFINITDCNIVAPIAYGLILDNHVDPDAGGFHITGTNFVSGLISGLSAIGVYIKGGGGVYLSGCFWNAQSNIVPADEFLYGIYSDFSTGPTSDYHFENLFFENFQISAIKLRNYSGAIVRNIQLHQIEIAPVNSSGTPLCAIDISNFVDVIVYDIKGINYLASIPHAVVKLDSITTIDIGIIRATDYNSEDSILHSTGIRRIVESDAVSTTKKTLSVDQLNVNSTTSAAGISLDGTTTPAFSMSKSGTPEIYMGVATSNNDWFLGSLAGASAFKTTGPKMYFGSTLKTTAPLFLDSTVYLQHLKNGTGTYTYLVHMADSSIAQVSTGGGGGTSPGGSDTYVQFNDAGTFNGDADFAWDKTANVLTLNGGVVLSTGTGTNRTAKGYNTSVTDGFPQPSWYPASGTNVGVALAVIPKGTGLSSVVKSQISVFNTDYVADATNYESLLLRAAGASFTIDATKGGTGTVRPINFQTGDVTAFTINTDQTVTAASGLTANYFVSKGASSLDGIRFYKDATPSKASNLGMAVPGSALSDNMVFSIFNGATWNESGRVVNSTRDWLFGTTVDNGMVTVGGVIAPEANITRDLGTTSFAFRDLYNRHIITAGSAPAFHSGSLGTNVTSITVTGTDGAMHLVIVTSGAVSGTIGSVDYNAAWAVAPKVFCNNTSNSTGNAAVPIIANATSSTLLVLGGVIAGAGTYGYDVISMQ